MTELEKTQNLIKEYDANYGDTFDAFSAIKYTKIYHQEALAELLKADLPKQQQKEEYIQCIINLASTKYCKTLVDELAKKHIIINLEKINSLLKSTMITMESIIDSSEDLTQAFFSTESILLYLTYDSNPLNAFERFLKRQHIKISLGNAEFRFCFTFLNDHTTNNKVNYYCDCIYEFLKLCPYKMIENVCDELVRFISIPLKTIQTLPIENIDYGKISNLRGRELYEYLIKFEFIRVNYNLEDLYLMLYYDKIEIFHDENVMDMLLQRIIQGEL